MTDSGLLRPASAAAAGPGSAARGAGLPRVLPSKPMHFGSLFRIQGAAEAGGRSSRHEG